MTHYRGILGFIKTRLDRRRLGEVLVQGGKMSPTELKHALDVQKEQRRPLGEILIEQGLASAFQVRRALCEQIAIRVMAACLTVFISISSFGPKQARAANIKDIPEQVTLVNSFHTAMAPLNYYPALFGSEEKKSKNLRPFTKWSSMFDRLDRSMSDPAKQQLMADWRKELYQFKSLPLDQMATKINSYINEYAYKLDSNNWGQSDHWATPLEFFVRGGDCEDFAIAKYASLRALGVPEERLRLAVVHDKEKNIPHAILIVYTDRGAMVLDNQIKTAKMADRVTRYRPIFSINRSAWWLHSKPQASTIRIAQR